MGRLAAKRGKGAESGRLSQSQRGGMEDEPAEDPQGNPARSAASPSSATGQTPRPLGEREEEEGGDPTSLTLGALAPQV